jgi:NAD(P)H-hydrate epimerase
LQHLHTGVYIHGLCGDLARDEKGEMGMIAGDMMEKIPESILMILKDLVASSLL